jgi:acyl-CoA dehydrogenase
VLAFIIFVYKVIEVRKWREWHAEREPAPEGQITQMVVLGEESAYWDRGMGVAAPGAGPTSGIIAAAGTSEQKQRFLGPFARLSMLRWTSFARGMRVEKKNGPLLL